jgi:hypothetical protein
MNTSTSSAMPRIGPRWVIRVLALILVAVPGLVLSPAFAQAATCGITWGSLPKTATAGRVADPTVRNVRAGEQACYDRLVVDLAGKVRAASVRYVPQVVSDGSGAVVALRGGARLQIVVDAPAYDVAGRATYLPRNRSELVNVTGYRTLRQVAWAGSFEGTTTIGLGVRARLPMRVFVLDGPGGGSRVVIDVANRW